MPRKPTTRRKSRTTAKKATVRDPAEIPTPRRGERLWVLELPWGTRLPQVTYLRTWKANVWVGAELPPEMRAFASRPYTYQRVVEDAMNAHHDLPPAPVRADRRITPRPEQIEGTRTLVRAAHAGAPQTLLADDMGVGKTVTSVLTAKALARLGGARTVLVVASRPGAITVPGWSATIAACGDDGLTWCVVTWDNISKVTGWHWDLIVADEAQYLRHQSTKRWRTWERLSGLSNSRNRPAHQLMVTATPGHNPLELGYLAPMFAHATGEQVRDWVGKDGDAFATQLAAHGIHVSKGRYGWEWTSDARERQQDLAQIASWQTSGTTPVMIHREAPWGPVQIIGEPIDLTVDQRRQYEAEWGEFCAEMALARKGNAVAKGRALVQRFRQKASMIRADITAEWVIDRLERGYQVVVSVENVDTGGVPIYEALTARGVDVARAYGTATDGLDLEAERRRFQTGKAPVIVTTRTEAISLHAGEDLGSGVRATTTPRVGVFHQARYSGISGRQITGRTHRDYQRSNWHVLYGAGTIEEQVGKLMIERYAAATDMVGGDTSALEKIAGLLHAQWMPLDALGDDSEK